MYTCPRVLHSAFLSAATLPGSTSGKEPICHCRTHKRSLGWEDLLEEDMEAYSMHSHLGKSHEQRSLVGYSSQGAWSRTQLKQLGTQSKVRYINFCFQILKHTHTHGTSLVVQWLRRHTSNEVGTDSIHGWGWQSHMPCSKTNKFKKLKYKIKIQTHTPGTLKASQAWLKVEWFKRPQAPTFSFGSSLKNDLEMPGHVSLHCLGHCWSSQNHLEADEV